MRVELPQDEVNAFADVLGEANYLDAEREYKIAVHEVVSRLLSADQLETAGSPSQLSAFFGRRLDLASIGIDNATIAQIESAVGRFHGITNAFINLAGGRFAVNNFIWVPGAVDAGLGDEIRSAFRNLVHGDDDLAARVDLFRDELYTVEEEAKRQGAFQAQWTLVKISLGFVAALLGAFDPERYSFYHRGKLEHSYTQLVGPWPSVRGGALYEAVCSFVSAVRSALVAQGAPVKDMIDAQSFLYLRAPTSAVVGGVAATNGRAWVFQANPDYYDIDRALRQLPAIEWTVRQHRAAVHAGDRTYIWRSGAQGGVVAVGTVKNDPQDRGPNEGERPYYLRPEAFNDPEPRVDVLIDRVLDSPLSRRVLAEHPVLKDMTVIRMQGRGTNFALTDDQDAALRELLDEELTPSQGHERYFVLQQRADQGYDSDDEGRTYHFTPNASGAWRRLWESPGAYFVYYRPGGGGDGARTYFGTGRISHVDEEQREGERHFLARISEYREFSRAVPRSEFDPRPNVQMSIAEISQTDFAELLRRGASVVTEPFTLETLRSASERLGIRLPDEIYANLYAALESGKHVILTGPPGTGKTTLAQAAADAARNAARCNGYLTTTATADWTTYETIGGLKPDRSAGLSFAEGHFLEAIEQNRWLVIDELNRSNFDRAFGQLFTVLSGHAVELPYERSQGRGRIALVPQGASAPDGADVIAIPPDWRVIATMNVFDKSLLFEMSFALMRRFAFVEVPAPEPEVFAALVESAAAPDSDAASLAKRFLALRTFKDLGPAVFMDLARFLRERRALGTADDGQLAFEGFYGFLLPQFEGIDEVAGEHLFVAVKRLVGAGRADRLRRTLNAVLGLELTETLVPTGVDSEDLFEPDQPDVDLKAESDESVT